MKYLLLCGAGLFAAATAGFPVSAEAQERNRSWQFSGQNRASIAALIREVEEGGDSNGAVAGYTSPGYTSLVCGGDGQASATGNSTCIILHNSDGFVDVGQDSDGTQTATSTSQTDGASNTPPSGSDDVLDTLNGDSTQ